jgi:hypothetical protein
MTHPLIAPESTHYRVNRDEVLQHARDGGMFLESELYRARYLLPKECEMIQILELLLTPEQLQGFALGNYLKYARNKDQDKADEVKATRYRKYYRWLQK